MSYHETKPLTEDQAKAVYQILVEECGASTTSTGPMSFIFEFTSDRPCTEWRFQGFLGFGGKFRYPRMSVDCYREDETPDRLKAIAAANKRLTAFKAQLSLN